MNYDEWLEANYLTDDASAQLMYEEQAQKIGRPYDEWRKRYGYSDTATARADYAEYQKQLDILTPAKRGPGRPPTGNAMTPAEKQRAYRQRVKERQDEAEAFKARCAHLENELAKAMNEIERLKRCPGESPLSSDNDR